MRDEEYRKVTVTLERIGVNVFYINDGKMLPRSLVHGGDEMMVMRNQFDLPREITIRVMTWKCRNLGLK